MELQMELTVHALVLDFGLEMQQDPVLFVIQLLEEHRSVMEEEFPELTALILVFVTIHSLDQTVQYAEIFV
jgi:hypothetical protein